MARRAIEEPRVRPGRTGDGLRVFTVPPGRPFLDAIASAILKGDLPRPGGPMPSVLDLADMTLLLPTRRAARALQEAFLRTSGSRAMLLPRIRPIAEGEEDFTLLSGLAAAGALGGDDLPPAISELERRLVLTELVLRWSETVRPMGADGALSPFAGASASTPAQAAGLAFELAKLIDTVEIENASLAGLSGLVPAEFSEHWERTLRFLEIVRAWWPAHLAERSLSSAMDHRNRLILAEAQRLRARIVRGPMIVAGVTGGFPTIVELMRAVAALEAGAIVLPGLDQSLDEDSWQAIMPGHPEHPQFGMCKLLAALAVERRQVAVLPGAATDSAAGLRARIVSEALRPSSTTELWHVFADSSAPGAVTRSLAGLTYLAAPDAHDEAEAIALLLREVAETPQRTAALVSPDRLLARRVAVRLESWGIHVDDSAGRPFAKTVPGAFLDLVVDAVSRRFEPAALMALLKHPLTRLGLPAAAVRRAARSLELIAFRSIYLGHGLAAVEAALERASASGGPRRRHQAVRRLRDSDWQAARDLVQRLTAAFAPMTALFEHRSKQRLRTIAAAHLATAEALARAADTAEEGSSLWADEAGTAAALFFAGVLDVDLPGLAIATADYPELYRALLAGESVRPRVPAHPRLHIWGPFEARLQQPDVVILGSLNEGTWPAATDPGPWLSRPMRNALGLPQPEERIGQAAHDVAQLLGAARVYLTRAEKIDGIPTVPSRWLLRLEALLGGMGLADALRTEQHWLGWARQRDTVAKRTSVPAPAPRPPVVLRPRSLSVSDVETWIANPYAVFASKILALEPLPELGREPDAALRGAIVHEALGRFAQRFPEGLPRDVTGELMAVAEAILTEYIGHARIAAFWKPRFAHFAAWFAETEPLRRKGLVRTVSETKGAAVLAAPAGPFTLTARVDRIDLLETGLVITDYKTGSGIKDLAQRAVKGEAPQLPLEAAIAADGGFGGLAEARVSALRYIAATGGEPGGAECDLKTGDVAGLARVARAGLAQLVAEFDRAETPYRAVRRARFSYDYDVYAHLARVAEWSAITGAEDVDP